MPHLLLETTADLVENDSIPQILERLVEVMSGFETVDPKMVKARHTLRTNWVMGEGAPAGFAHLTCSVLSGRPLELRQKMGEGLLASLRDSFRESLEAGEVLVSLEVREMASETYFR